MRVVFTFLLVACGGAAEQATVVVPTQPIPTPSASGHVPAPIVAPATFKCDAGKRFEVVGRSYCAYETGESWDKAEERCVATGGHLMSLDSRNTSDALHLALGSPVGAGRAAWMGLELKTKGKSDWKWISGEALKDANWNEGEPNNWDGNEMCGEWLVADGRWNDTRCNLKQPYLCQGQKLDCKGGRSFVVGDTSYCLNPGNRTYQEAKTACAGDGGALATFKEKADSQKIRAAAAAKFAAARMWIGLTDAAAEGEWRWASGSRMSWTAWQRGEPNDFDTENCVELWADTWTWNDFDCGARRPFVCEAPAK